MVLKLTLIEKWLLYIRKNWIIFVKNGKKFKLKKKEISKEQMTPNMKMNKPIQKIKEKLNFQMDI